MPWPPVIPPAGRTNATAELDAHPSDHNAISQALTDIVAQVNPSAWTNAALSAPWANMAGNALTQYRKVGDRVEVRGAVSAGNTGQTILTLPVGFRPPLQVMFTAMGSDSVIARLTLTAAGVLTPTFAGGAATVMPLQFSFSVTP